MGTRGCTRQDGGFVIIVLLVFMLVAICAFGGLAIDVGKLYVVKSQLRNAADSAALAGAGNLYPSSSVTSPNWGNYTSALNVLRQNKAAGELLQSGDVQYGWWNLATNSWEVGSPVSGGVVPLLNRQGYCSEPPQGPCTPTSACPAGAVCIFTNLAAGVTATVSKSAGINGGPVPAPFAGVLGSKAFEVGMANTPSTAVIGPTGGVPSGVYPFAITKDTADYWAGRLNQPAYLDLINHGADPYRGQWATFDGTNNVPVIDKLLAASKTALSIGVDKVHIASGEKAALFDDVKINADVLLPVVATDHFNYNGDPVLTGFIGFHIDSVDTPNFRMRGSFIRLKAPPGSHAGGPSYGVISYPYLVQ
ncbi:pilus assembly protein TadG-related protein [Geomonas sp.]|uniref:pilus assembly protein TadG-related protein n=1 Tax=Geomonas sp. TaxID=2651584 RepID=UPI002B472A9C|nr:pilus assembly protein TadG-related protein [Geomonas sp.]HJV35022.1 pilus assembly protein TadG-related protein [Geomonas sp.]